MSVEASIRNVLEKTIAPWKRTYAVEISVPSILISNIRSGKQRMRKLELFLRYFLFSFIAAHGDSASCNGGWTEAADDDVSDGARTLHHSGNRTASSPAAQHKPTPYARTR